MEQLNYHALGYILDKCVSGEIDMHEPIEITNKLKNQKTDMSLLKHLLLLCKSDKKSLIHILSVLRYNIKSHLLELIDDNAFIRHYVQNIISEWGLDISVTDLFKDGLDQCDYNEGTDLFDYNNYVTEKRFSQEGGSKIMLLERGLRERQEEFKPVTSDYAEMIQDKVKDLHEECYECMGRVKKYSSETMDKCKMLDPYHKDVLIDLSSKSKSTYLEFSHKARQSGGGDDGGGDRGDDGSSESIFSTFLNDKHDLDIPDNIHTIFLNYLITLNMVKKEMNFISHSLKNVLSSMQPKVLVLTQLMNGLNELDINELTVEEEAMHPDKSLIISNTGEIREEEGGPLAFIKKGMSFF